MESVASAHDQQTPPTAPMSNSSSRRKQSKPNRLEHVILDSTPTCDTVNASGIPSSLTQYHVAAEQQESGIADDDSDRISLNCEDGSLSSHSTGEHYAMEDIINRSRRSSHPQSRSNEKSNSNGTAEQNFIEENQQEEHVNNPHHHPSGVGVLDFSLKLDNNSKHPSNSSNRPRSLNSTGKSRSLKRKSQSGASDNSNGSLSMPKRIFHADAFCSICQKEFCNKYFLKTHLANKHGIFDHQSTVPSMSAGIMSSLQEDTDSSMQHPFTVISTLLQNGHDDCSSSPTSPSSDLMHNPSNNDEDNDGELTSLRNEMNGVIADDDMQQEDDEQDGTNSNSLIHLPRQIASLLRNDKAMLNPLSMLNDPLDESDEQHEAGMNSPSNSLDYHQHHLQQPSPSSSSQLTILPLTPSPSTTTNPSRQSSAKLPEDFCDICQKHFCNKYYLRKHKLDVHGVQTDCNIKPYKRIDNTSLSTKSSPPSMSSQQMSTSIQLPSSFPSVAFNSSSVQQSLGMLLNPIFSPLVQSQTNSEPSNKRRQTDNSNESTSKSSYPTSILTVASDVANVLANQLASAANGSTSSSKSQISTCHLCGKKFQSNDYLQLHLMNKHQITAETKNYDLLQHQQRTKLSATMKSSNGSLNSSTVKKIKLETNEATPLSSSKAIKGSSSPADTMASSNPPGMIPGIVDTYFAAKMADRVSCNICHKQVCNKYFLKTHKLKVHGIGPDTLVNSSASSMSLQNADLADETSEHQQQSQSSFDGSPPQLVVDEMNPSNSEPGVIPNADALSATVNALTNIAMAGEQTNTSICELCSKSFPTKFLHVHMNNVHGIQQQPSGSSNGTAHAVSNTKNALAGGSLKRALPNGNSNVRLKQTPQVQLRVTCQVCKKELCNKYFLRAHMRNVHNISVDDLRLISDQSTTSQLSPTTSEQSQTSKQVLSSSSNLLSSTSTTATDGRLSAAMNHASFNDTEFHQFNGHNTDSNESDNSHSTKGMSNYSSSFPTASKSTNPDDDNNNSGNNRLLSMQPFLVESDDDQYKDLFVPCMVYLPCRHRVTKPLEISLRLKPVDNTTSTAAATAALAD